MARKSYDQRLKERWLRKQKKENYDRFPGLELSYMRDRNHHLALILPLLLRKRNR